MSDALQTRLPPLTLAYVGDSVYEVYIRATLARNVSGSVHRLHTEATAYSKCASQADVIRHINDELTECEKDIVRRGRNANSGYVPKNANVADYRHATGFEALLGHLYLNGDQARLNEILELAARRVRARIEEENGSAGNRAGGQGL